MKNVTIALDDDTHRRARIRAAELGTSLSALVKNYLETLVDRPSDGEFAGVREMPMPFTPAPVQTDLPSGAYGRFADGTPYYTPGGKPRQPGAMRGMLGWTEDFDEWPDGFLKNIENGWPGTVKWWLPDAADSEDADSKNGKG